jgi:hypothetical protein
MRRLFDLDLAANQSQVPLIFFKHIQMIFYNFLSGINHCFIGMLSQILRKHPIILVLLLVSGCITSPYEVHDITDTQNLLQLREGEEQFEFGRPRKFLDASDWIWPGSLIGKLLLWNVNVDSHEVSDETVNELQEYLAYNDLGHVKIRINQYAPGGEWSRLFRNKDVGAGWRYTLGFISTIFYTILPQRFFGGDNYNPYTNTVSIYSNHKAIAVHEGGHSQDSSRRKHKGTYAALYMIPFVSLHHEAMATNDALSYMSNQAQYEELKGAYKILYPAYGTYVGGGIAQFMSSPIAYIIQVAAVIPGHIIGRVKASNVENPNEKDAEETDTIQQDSGIISHHITYRVLQ